MAGASSSSLSDSQLKSRLQEMDDYDFEHLIADLWERQGWRATVKQQSVDRGVDVVAKRDDPFPQKWLIQAKCYSNTVGGPEVRQYVSLQHRPGVDGAIVVSSGPFSKQARQEERDHNLKLIDGDDLVSLIRNTDSYDLVDRYITVESSVDSQVSEQASLDSSYSSEPVSSELSETSTDPVQSPPVSSDPPEQEQHQNPVQEQHQKESEEGTRLDKYLDKIENGSDVEEAIIGVNRILFERPPKNKWWKAIIGATGVWVSFFLVPSPLLDGVLGPILGFGLLIAWPLMPIALYMDSKVAPKYTADWKPYRWLYILGSLIPLGGVVAGPVYLAYRWWYGTNRDLGNVEEFRSNFREWLDELDKAAGAVGSEFEDRSTTDSGLDLYGEYKKHLEFVEIINNGNALVDTDLAADFAGLAMEGLKQGEMPNPQYQRIKGELQEAIRDSNAILRELKDTPPSSEFERTMELYKRYIREVEIVNSELEMFIEDVESGSVNEDSDELEDSLNAIEDLAPKLSRSIENDLKEINSFADNFDY